MSAAHSARARRNATRSRHANAWEGCTDPDCKFPQIIAAGVRRGQRRVRDARRRTVRNAFLALLVAIIAVGMLAGAWWLLDESKTVIDAKATCTSRVNNAIAKRQTLLETRSKAREILKSGDTAYDLPNIATLLEEKVDEPDMLDCSTDPESTGLAAVGLADEYLRQQTALDKKLSIQGGDG